MQGINSLQRINDNHRKNALKFFKRPDLIGNNDTIMQTLKKTEAKLAKQHSATPLLYLQKLASACVTIKLQELYAKLTKETNPQKKLLWKEKYTRLHKQYKQDISQMTEQLKLVVLGIGKAAKRMNTFKIENTKKKDNINNKPRKRQKITHNPNTNDDKVKKELNNILKKADLNVLHKQLKKWGNECSECMTLIKSMLKILDINDEQPNRDINDKKK
mmetsp:Transcript_7267/g.9041  ORF Transcript_7267/g.9041 Transcript_7267/m.9041 type:complete len:217 (+) Transcript_7267:150-800(+)